MYIEKTYDTMKRMNDLIASDLLDAFYTVLLTFLWGMFWLFISIAITLSDKVHGYNVKSSLYAYIFVHCIFLPIKYFKVTVAFLTLHSALLVATIFMTGYT